MKPNVLLRADRIGGVIVLLLIVMVPLSRSNPVVTVFDGLPNLRRMANLAWDHTLGYEYVICRADADHLMVGGSFIFPTGARSTQATEPEVDALRHEIAVPVCVPADWKDDSAIAAYTDMLILCGQDESVRPQDRPYSGLFPGSRLAPEYDPLSHHLVPACPDGFRIVWFARPFDWEQKDLTVRISYRQKYLRKGRIARACYIPILSTTAETVKDLSPEQLAHHKRSFRVDFLTETEGLGMSLLSKHTVQPMPARPWGGISIHPVAGEPVVVQIEFPRRTLASLLASRDVAYGIMSGALLIATGAGLLLWRNLCRSHRPQPDQQNDERRVEQG